MPCQKRTLDEPLIRELLTGLVRCDKRGYYKKDPLTGRYCEYPARVELMALAGLSEGTGSRLLKEAVKSGLITEEKIEHNAEFTATAANSPSRAATEAAVAASDEDIDDEDEEMEEFGSRATSSKSLLGLSDIPKGELDRYELVRTSSGFFAYFDREHQREVILSRDKEEVLEEIFALRRGQRDGDCFRWSDILQKTV